jgi:antitoxin Phd
MPKTYSIAEARNDLPSIVHDVERGHPVKLTRRGRPVAVIVSLKEYERKVARRPTFAEAYEAWRATVELKEVAVASSYFMGLRDRSPGRKVKL